jgi:hypothetical protein
MRMIMKVALAVGGVALVGAAVAGPLLYRRMRKQVFHVRLTSDASIAATDAVKTAALFNGVVATKSQLLAAQTAGAEWCKSGWVAEEDGATIKDSQYPMQALPIDPVTKKEVVTCGYANKVNTCNPADGCSCGVTVFGRKPSKADAVASYTVIPFSNKSWCQTLF